MSSQSIPLPDRLSITEGLMQKLQELARLQNITVSEALAQSINISDLVVRQKAEPGTKVLFKRGNRYKQLVLGDE